MQVKVAKKDLVDDLTACAAAIARKSTMPILSDVLLRAEEGKLKAMATDLYQCVQIRVPAEVLGLGDICVPALDLLARVKSLPEGFVELKTDDKDRLNIKAASSPRRFSIPGLSGDSFPGEPEIDPAQIIYELPADVLSKAIGTIEVTISNDESRANLNAMHWRIGDGRFILEATDGHRLHQTSLSLKGPEEQKHDILLSLKGVQILRKALESAKGELIRFGVCGPYLAFIVGETTIFSKLVDASFPSCDQVIPKSFGWDATTPREALIDALKAVSVAANARTGGVQLALSEGTLTITSSNLEGGEGSDEVPVDYFRDPVHVGINAGYVLDALRVLSTSEVLLRGGGELDPVCVVPIEEGARFVGVIMPMRL